MVHKYSFVVQGCPNPDLQGRSPAGFWSYQAENTSSKESVIPGEHYPPDRTEIPAWLRSLRTGFENPCIVFTRLNPF